MLSNVGEMGALLLLPAPHSIRSGQCSAGRGRKLVLGLGRELSKGNRKGSFIAGSPSSLKRTVEEFIKLQNVTT